MRIFHNYRFSDMSRHVVFVLLAVVCFAFCVTAQTLPDGSEPGNGISTAASDAYPTAVRLPVLLYHHITERGYGDATISRNLFEAQMEALRAAGYTTVLPSELIAFVNGDGILPEKPILITFDDGYLSNYQYAYPYFRARGMKAVIFIIGSTFGSILYKDTGLGIIPHFGAAQAHEMSRSGLIEFGSHTFDMHQSDELEAPPVRDSVMPFAFEDGQSYIAALENDMLEEQKLFREQLGIDVNAVSYPHGIVSPRAEAVFRRMGMKLSFTTYSAGHNTVRVGDPESLYLLYRLTVTETMSPADVLAAISETQPQ